MLTLLQPTVEQRRALERQHAADSNDGYKRTATQWCHSQSQLLLDMRYRSGRGTRLGWRGNGTRRMGTLQGSVDVVLFVKGSKTFNGMQQRDS